MKQLRKAMAVIFAVVLALSMTVTASAADGTGSITIDGGENDLNGVTFSAYKLFDVSVNEAVTSEPTEEPTEIKGQTVYTISNEFKNFFSLPTVGKDTAAEAYKYVTDENNRTDLFNKINDYIEDNEIVCDEVTGEEGNNTVTITPLENGLYIVLSDNLAFSYNLALIIDGNNSPVTVKGDLPTVDKKVNEGENNLQDNTTAKVGTTIDFVVTTKVPDMTGKTDYGFRLVDTLSKGLKLDKDTFKVYVDENVINTTDYTVKTVPETPDGTVNTELTITLTDFYNKYKDKSGAEIRFEYSAEITKDAIAVGDVESGTGNAAKVQYSTDPNFTSEDDIEDSNTDVVKIYNYTIKIENYDENNQPLSGGIFTVTKDDSEDPLKLKYDEEKGYYVIDDTNGTTNIEITPDNNGVIYIKDLDEGKYSVKQITPPAGYKNTESTNPQENTFDKNPTGQDVNSIFTATFTNKLDEGGLPETGGMGTVIFTVVGLALIAAVAGSFVISRRKKNS